MYVDFFFFCLRNHVIVVKIGENQDFLHYIAVLSSEPVSKWILQYMADKKYFRPQIEKKKLFPTFKKWSSQTPSMILPTYFHFWNSRFFIFATVSKFSVRRFQFRNAGDHGFSCKYFFWGWLGKKKISVGSKKKKKSQKFFSFERHFFFVWKIHGWK